LERVNEEEAVLENLSVSADGTVYEDISFSPAPISCQTKASFLLSRAVYWFGLKIFRPPL